MEEHRSSESASASSSMKMVNGEVVSSEEKVETKKEEKAVSALIQGDQVYTQFKTRGLTSII